jgi:hypothetical protein
MQTRDRALTQATAEALGDARAVPSLRYAQMGRPLDVSFPAGGARRDIAHGLGAIPDGYHVLLTTANLTADAPEAWTRDIAALKADAVNARAVVVFFTLLENEVDRA